MIDPTAPPPGALPYAPAAKAAPRFAWGTLAAWIVIWLTVGLIFGLNLHMSYGGRSRLETAKAEADPSKVPSVQLKLAAYTAISAHEKFPTTPADFTEQVREAAESPLERLRMAPVLGELQGPKAALQALNAFLRTDAAATTKPTTALVKQAAGSGAGTGTAAGTDPMAGLRLDAERFRTLYVAAADRDAHRDGGAPTTQPLSPAAQESLVHRHGWFAQLALTHGRPANDPARAAVLAPAVRAMHLSFGVFGFWFAGGAAGLLVLILALVFLAQGRVRRAYRFAGLPPAGVYARGQPMLAPRMYPDPLPMPTAVAYPPSPGAWPAAAAPGYGLAPIAPPDAPPPQWSDAPHALGARASWQQQQQRGFIAIAPELPSIPAQPARTGPFLEAFAIYLGGDIVLMVLLRYLFHVRNMLAVQWLALLPLALALVWPLLRGVPWADMRRGLGWHRGRGVFREIGAGILGYFGGIPLLGVGVIVFLILSHFTHLRAEHPIQNMVGAGWWNHLQLYLLACVWAPLVEETMFRGALLHHLRQRWRWLAAAPFVALLFAAIHPQGWTSIPVLGAFAVSLAAVREWRGSLIGSITLHFMQNFVAVTMMIVLLG